jgi:hypothetical protein
MTDAPTPDAPTSDAPTYPCPCGCGRMKSAADCLALVMAGCLRQHLAADRPEAHAAVAVLTGAIAD